ncbi:hypothetical protein D0869_02870 [Hortaea werneckii]|uniref:Uncharacterized protein n=1 Tax=Hortaea werneckii TaxID=91943 RepID=A0A3M6X8E1_HORWE|nr:hypothetical protein D0869_02870 [Hortaea werneckii]RMY06326.1 hypothetical protein D0868_05926 [Hortaea werneckii]
MLPSCPDAAPREAALPRRRRVISMPSALLRSPLGSNSSPVPSALEEEKKAPDPEAKMPKDQRKYSDPSSLNGSTGNRGSVSPVASKSKPVIHQQPNEKVYEPGQKGYEREDKWR